MNKTIKLLGVALALISSAAFAATTTSAGGNIVRMTANGDSMTQTRVIVKRVKVTPRTTGKTFELREGSTTGTVVWEHSSHNSTLANPVAEPVFIKVGTSPLYFVTDDSTATVMLEL